MKTSIQNHSKLSIIEKRRNKTRFLTWNSITLKLVKNTSMLNPVKSLGYIKCYSSSSTRPFKSPDNYIRYKCQKICNWWRRPKTILEIRKRPHFSRWSTILLFTSFFKDLINRRKKTNRAVVLSYKPFPKIFKYRDHQWNLQNYINIMQCQITSRRENRKKNAWVIQIRVLRKVFSKQFCFMRCWRQCLHAE